MHGMWLSKSTCVINIKYVLDSEACDCLGSYNKYYQLGDLSKRYLFLIVAESKVQNQSTGMGLVTAPLLIMSPHCLSLMFVSGEGNTTCVSSSSHEGINPIIKTPPF